MYGPKLVPFGTYEKTIMSRSSSGWGDSAHPIVVYSGMIRPSSSWIYSCCSRTRGSDDSVINTRVYGVGIYKSDGK